MSELNEHQAPAEPISEPADAGWRFHPWLLLAGVGVSGGLALLLFDHPGPTAAGLFLAGVLLGGGAFALGGRWIRWAGRNSPIGAMTAALSSYGLTVLFFAFLLAQSYSYDFDPAPFAGGLGCAVVVWVAESIRAAMSGVKRL